MKEKYLKLFKSNKKTFFYVRYNNVQDKWFVSKIPPQSNSKSGGVHTDEFEALQEAYKRNNPTF